jgi:hypothetical protein
MFDLAKLLVIVILATGRHAVFAAEVHVAPGGNNAQPGTQAQPFATLERARDEARRLRKAGQPVTVTVHAGSYLVGTSLKLGPEDSGTDSSPVVWQAAPGEEVRLIGGLVLSGDSLRTITDEKVLSRLDGSARGNVVQADLRGLGIEPPADYPEIFRGVPAVPELFFNDHRMTIARWPNDGWTTIAKIIDAGSNPRVGDKTRRPGVFEYAGDRPGRWNVAAGVWLQGYWCFDWYEETIRVKAIDAGKRQITLARPSLYSIKQGNPSPRRFCALNLLEELDRPGEYYIDRTAGVLYLWPPSQVRGARIVLSTLNAPVLVLNDASHLVVRGFIVEAGLGNGVDVAGGRDNRIEGCQVRNTRQLGIRVSGGFGHRVDGCSIHDTGTGGLLLEGGDRKTLVPAGHLAVNNHIWRFSQHQFTSAYGLVLGGVGNRAAHNLVHDAPHQAIGINGNDHVFEYNIVRNVVTQTDDAGALYKGRNPSCRGNVIRYNLWRDIGSPMGHGNAAVYFDDGDGGDTVFGNVFFRCGEPGKGSFGTVFSHGGHDNLAENNIFIECKRALGSAPWNDKRWREALQGGMGCNWQTRLLKEVDITKPPYTTHYPKLVGFLDPPAGQPRVNRAKNNVLVRCGQVSSGNWKVAADETWVTDQDPGFVDAARGNFQLRPDAEVFNRLPGFQPIPFDKIGPQGRRGTD